MGDLTHPSLDMLPAITLSSPKQADDTTLDQFKGKVVLLNFWATWCAPCVKEIPSLDRLAGKYAAQGFTVLAASQDMTGMLTVETFLKQHHLDHLAPYIDENAKTFQRLGLNALPTSFLIGRDGRIAAIVSGEYDWDSPAAHLAVEKALGS